ncbi:MAG: Gfo/Idh/MocA family oxidoreductase [Rhodothermales bacterium]
MLWTLLLAALTLSQPAEPLRLAIVGLVHGHVGGFLNSFKDRDDLNIVGLYDPSEALHTKYAGRYGIDRALFYDDLERMLVETKPEAVTVFTNTFDHKMVVELCAKYGIDVMMEKPLAVNMEHARAMAAAAKAGGIELLVNYETTWYKSHAAIEKLVDAGSIGAIQKVVIHDGHRGPEEMGVDPEFLEWLVDPVLNGGGALTDFGCYGANLLTWLLKGERPKSVYALLQQYKKNNPTYARVDDEANIVVEYENAVGIIQASWNWSLPVNRKDMEVYGHIGQVITPNGNLAIAQIEKQPATELPLPDLAPDRKDFIALLTAVVRGELKLAPHDLSSLENNLLVTEILDAARESARTGQRVMLRP